MQYIEKVDFISATEIRLNVNIPAISWHDTFRHEHHEKEVYPNPNVGYTFVTTYGLNGRIYFDYALGGTVCGFHRVVRGGHSLPNKNGCKIYEIVTAIMNDRKEITFRFCSEKDVSEFIRTIEDIMSSAISMVEEAKMKAMGLVADMEVLDIESNAIKSRIMALVNGTHCSTENPRKNALQRCIDILTAEMEALNGNA